LNDLTVKEEKNKLPLTRRFCAMAGLSRPKFCITLQPVGSSQRLRYPPLRQSRLGVIGKRYSAAFSRQFGENLKTEEKRLILQK
jgi:hypothetical protein